MDLFMFDAITMVIAGEPDMGAVFDAGVTFRFVMQAVAGEMQNVVMVRGAGEGGVAEQGGGEGG